MPRLIYRFGGDTAARAAPVARLGAKGARLQELAQAGLPVPPGLTISAPTCDRIRAEGGKLSPTQKSQLRTSVRWLEKAWRGAVGDKRGPIAFAVRCSPQIACRGLMPTQLNIGTNEQQAAELPPRDCIEQLARAIGAAAVSWDSTIAQGSRQKAGIVGGTMAVIVQPMAFGLDERNGAGSVSTRDPITGKKVLTGEFHLHTEQNQTDDVPRIPISRLRQLLPVVWKRLLRAGSKLESYYADAVSMQFCFDSGRLFILDARPVDRTAKAAVRIAVELAQSRIIDKKTAVLRVAPEKLETLLRPSFDRSTAIELLTEGLGASPGAAVGKIAFTAEEAGHRAAAGEKIILVRHETDAADVGGMRVCQGILTSTGGMTSHAALVARGMGTPCVSGAGAIHINVRTKVLQIDGKRLGVDDWLSIDGSSGQVMAGRVLIVDAEVTGPFKTIARWADLYRTLKIRANADTPHDAQVARNFGAEGIGLARTEHMFFDPQRIHHMREMILAADGESRKTALAKLLPYQKDDFIGIFKAMKGLPVTIRLLDPPLHEFLPHHEKEQAELARSLGKSLDEVRKRVEQLHEANPMLGHRGDRLAVTYPEILEMQVRAIIEAAVECKKQRIVVLPEIMIPLAGTKAELDYLKQITVATAEAVFAESKMRVEYLYGTMIEVPRAAITADELAQTAEFFSFGTNDLTQMTFGYSRDDAGVFLPDYIGKEILEHDPFQSIDTAGVGKLMKMGVELGRSTRPDLKCGICGEHGGDPKSVIFCHQIGLNYVSCSPFRVPIARLAAAHAALQNPLGAKKKRSRS
jgi:pyruvate,orthophosphate dikinase